MDRQFSSRLAFLIRQSGRSATDFARKAKIPQGTLSKCLRGHVPTARILLRIARCSGRSVDWLLMGKEPALKKPALGPERPARRSPAAKERMVDEQIWVNKLLKVLRSRDSRRKQTAKKLLAVLSP